MATTVSAWAKPGAWALASEQEDALEILEQENGRVNSDSIQNNLQNPQQQQPLSDFPSLASAAVKPKKKKSQAISLAQFTTGKSVSHGAAKARPMGLTPDQLIILPTGPRERSAEELDLSSSRLGGGFRNNGGGGRDYDRRSPVVGGDEANSTRWGSSRVSDEPRRNGGLGFNRESVSSRADEIDDWGAGKKSAPPPERRDRGSGSGGFFDSQSRADESDRWLSNKSFLPSENKRIGGGLGLGFDSYKEKRGGFEMFHKEGSNADSESWGRKNEERLRSGDSDSWGKKEEGSGRPRIVLQPRTLPVSNGEQVGPARGGKGSNPFGEARPREEVLAEKGQDWKKIDEQLESMKIKEMGPSDGLSFGKKSFGSGNGRAEDRMETNWRKTDLVDVTHPRAEEDDGEVVDN